MDRYYVRNEAKDMGLGKEPSIVINGVQLTPAEAMTVRVAVGTFAITLNEGTSTELNSTIREGYQRCIDRVHALMRVGM